MLLEQPGQVVLREEIRKKLWPNDTVVEFDHSINAAVMRLREALDDDADTPRYVETLPRRGYRFIYAVDGVRQGLDPPSPDAAPAVPVMAPPITPVPADFTHSNLIGRTLAHYR